MKGIPFLILLPLTLAILRPECNIDLDTRLPCLSEDKPLLLETDEDVQMPTQIFTKIKEIMKKFLERFKQIMVFLNVQKTKSFVLSLEFVLHSKLILY